MKNLSKFANGNAIPTDTLIKIITDVIEYRQMGYTNQMIDEFIVKDYGVGNPIDMRKYASLLEKLGMVNINVDSKSTLDKIARAKQKQLIQQKINVKQRNLLNFDANVEAFRQMIADTLKDYKWKKYSKLITPKKLPKLGDCKKGIFIIADEHYKGLMDESHLQALYDSIEYDIKYNKYTNVEIWYLGDGIDGLIHTGSLASNNGSIQPAIEYANIIIERVNKIKQVSRILFVNKSNHTQTRALGTSRNELAREDLGLVIGELLKKGLRPDIQVVCDDIIRVEEQGLQVALLHGHQPYAHSKAKMLEYWNSKYHLVPDLTIMGHYHTYKCNEYGDNKWLVVAPTAKSFNGDYEESQGFISTNQYMILTFENGIPQFKIRKANNGI